MGYYTYHSLLIQNATKEQAGQILSYMETHDDEQFYALDWASGIKDIKKLRGKEAQGGFYISGTDTTKWYEHDKDMVELSEQFPSVLFELQGEGENSEDLWKTYYRGGRLQHASAIIVYPPFDVSALEPLHSE
jgi:hypothetical protein